jgi:hypothetical protein
MTVLLVGVAVVSNADGHLCTDWVLYWIGCCRASAPILGCSYLRSALCPYTGSPKAHRPCGNRQCQLQISKLNISIS